MFSLTECSYRQKMEERAAEEELMKKQDEKDGKNVCEIKLLSNLN